MSDDGLTIRGTEFETIESYDAQGKRGVMLVLEQYRPTVLTRLDVERLASFLDQWLEAHRIDATECSVCRRTHGQEVRHAAE